MKQNWTNTTEHFEQLLQTEAESFSAYPSDKVWDNIREELHGKPKWPALIFIFSSIVLALTIATIHNYPPQKFIVRNNISILPNKKIVSVSSNKISTHNLVEKRANDIIESFLFAHPNIPKANITKSYASKNIVEHATLENKIFANELQETNAKNESINVADKLNDIAEINEYYSDDKDIASSRLNDFEMNSSSTTEPRYVNNMSAENKMINSNDVNNYLKTLKKNVTDKQQKKSNWQIQYYTTVSNSYRVLEDDKTRLIYTTNTAERQALKNDINDIVKQKPSVGGEIGFAFLRKLSKQLYIKTGLQFNVRQYGTDAYMADGNATFSYVQNNHLNSFSLKSSYATQAGNTAKTTLDNTLYQISIPIGVQWNVVNGGRWGLSAAASIQPTVTLNKNVYVISTDYKYYVDGTSFFRRLNVNTTTELYLTLKAKNIKWFFGPQIRYQQMPTFNDIYPIKEYRVDYGIKFGFTESL